MSYIKVTQVSSLIGAPKKVVHVVKGMGLGRIGQEKVYRDTRAIRGAVNKVRHLVRYELLDEKPGQRKAPSPYVEVLTDKAK